jgi:competence protein ComEC
MPAAAVPAFVLVAGLASAVAAAWPVAPAAGALVVCLLVSGAGWARGRPGLAQAGLLCGFAMAGIALGGQAIAVATRTGLAAFVAARPDGPRREAPLFVVEGRLRADAQPTDYGASLVVDVERLHDDRGSHAVTGGLRLAVGGAQVSERIGEWRAGRRVRAPASLRLPAPYRNPGVPDQREALVRRGVAAVGSVKSAALVEIVGRGGPADELPAAARAWVREVVARHVERHGAQSAAIVTAILIGDRAGLDDEVTRRLQEAGTFHVIAISGGNIAILTGVLLWVAGVARVGPRLSALLAVGPLAAYAVVAGGGPSVVRATLVASLYLAGRALDLTSSSLNLLAASAILVAAAAPLSVFDAGFALTFGATAGILLVAPRLVPPVAAWLDARGLSRWVRNGVLVVAALAAATFGAEVALMPVGVQVFSRVTLAGFALNFVAIPLMTLVQLAGMATLVLERVSAPAAAVAGYVAHVAAEGLVESARGVDLAPWTTWRVAPAPAWTLALYYTGVVAWLAGRRGSAWRRAGLVAAAGSAAILCAGPVWAARLGHACPAICDCDDQVRWRGPTLRVAFLDVGQGDSTLVSLPDGRHLLVDAGGTPTSSTFDVGERIVMRALWALGVRRLDWLLLTHGDADHAGGARAIAGVFHPREVWEGVPVPRDAGLARLRRESERRGLVWRQRFAGDSLLTAGVRLRVLHPPPPDWERQRVRNDDSLVVELVYGQVTVLLAGDIGRDVESEVARRVRPSGVVVLKVPHHGSGGSSSESFVNGTAPTLAIVSAGAGNLFGHPTPAVIARYRQAGARVLRTDRHGAVFVETDGGRLHVRTMAGERWIVDADERASP